MARNKYKALFFYAIKKSARAFPATCGLLLFLFVCLFVFAHVWEYVDMSFISIKKSELLYYIALNEWVLLSIPFIHFDIHQLFKKNTLTSRLLLPISFVNKELTEAIGKAFFHFIFLGIGALSFAALWTGSFPFTLFSFSFILITSFLATILGTLLYMTVGIFSFWFEEILPIFFLLQQLLFLFGGLLLPLALYPKWTHIFFPFLPFYYILGGRSQLLFVDPQPLTYLLVIGGVSIWIVLMKKFNTFLFQRGLKG